MERILFCTIGEWTWGTGESRTHARPVGGARDKKYLFWNVEFTHKFRNRYCLLWEGNLPGTPCSFSDCANCSLSPSPQKKGNPQGFPFLMRMCADDQNIMPPPKPPMPPPKPPMPPPKPPMPPPKPPIPPRPRSCWRELRSPISDRR